MIKDMDFGEAITRLCGGGCVTRSGWNGKGMWLELQVPDEHSKMTQPYLVLCSGDNIWVGGVVLSRVPWVPSQTDILAQDWRVARTVHSPSEENHGLA